MGCVVAGEEAAVRLLDSRGTGGCGCAGDYADSES